MKLITRDEFLKLFSGRNLQAMESFTDPDGAFLMSFGKPRMETVWGIDGIKICESIATKSDRHQLDWDWEYFEYEIDDQDQIEDNE